MKPPIIYNKYDVEPDSPICLYMELDHFITMMEKNQFHINRRKTFSDERESRLPTKFRFGLFTSIGEKPSPEAIEAHTKLVECRKLNYEILKELPTSCWTSKPTENYLMWAAYTSKFGVCIKSTPNKFISSFAENPYTIVATRVKYNNHDFSGKDDFAGKHRYFEDEREVRFCFLKKDGTDTETDGNTYIKLDVNAKEMIQQVIISPRISSDCARLLKNHISDKYGIKCTLSEIGLHR